MKDRRETLRMKDRRETLRMKDRRESLRMKDRRETLRLKDRRETLRMKASMRFRVGLDLDELFAVALLDVVVEDDLELFDDVVALERHG